MYCILGRGKINAWIARGGAARVSVNFRKFSPCIARAARPRGFDSLPSLLDVGTFSFSLKKCRFCFFFLRKWNKAMPKSVILLRPSIQQCAHAPALRRPASCVDLLAYQRIPLVRGTRARGKLRRWVIRFRGVACRSGVRFFYFYTRNHYRYCMLAFGTFPTVFV